MEWLRAEYTEVWISSPVVPLIHFADSVRSIASTGLDLVGLTEGQIDRSLRERLESFDEIVSWYGTRREDFRSTVSQLDVRWRFIDALPPADNTLHAADFFSLQVGAPMDRNPRLPKQKVKQSRDSVVIHPFSGSGRKNWPIELYLDLAKRLPLPVEWVAGPEEVSPDAHRFSRLDQLAEWLRGARLYVGNDSGITHLAAAIGVPTLVLFGPTDPRVWAPRGDHVRVIRHQPLHALPVDSVLRQCTIEEWN